MFDYTYKIEFKTREVTNIFWRRFLCRQVEFWNAHQSTLTDLYKKVISTGSPFTITDLKTSITLKINTQKEFDTWITTHQPFTIPE